MATKVGTVLREIRESSGKTLATVAGDAKISISLLSMVERNQRRIKPELLHDLAVALNTTVDAIYLRCIEKPDDLDEDLSLLFDQVIKLLSQILNANPQRFEIKNN